MGERQRYREYLYWLGFMIILGSSVSMLVLGYIRRAENEIFWSAINAVIGGVTLFSVIYFAFLAISACFAPVWDKRPIAGCTVIVPAYNEGRQVAETLLSLMRSDFPQEKLQIIAVNDGSADDTLYWMNQIAGRFPEVIRVIDLPENRGKKAALCTGIREAVFDFVVTVDSDTVVKRDTLDKLLYPFKEQDVGAVAGTIVKNSGNSNFHTLMCDVMLVFGCGLLRKAQSCCGNVFCTPGALSAYRKCALLPLLDCWLSQKFLGVPSRIGEDRAIATLLLQNNWRIVYQESAVAETKLPESYCGICRMLLRWTRSDIRENLLMSKYVLKELFTPDRKHLNLFLHWCFLSVNMLLPFFLLPAAVMWCLEPAGAAYKFSLLFTVNVLWSLIPAVIYWRYKRSLRQVIWAFIFGFYAQFAISWIAIYSVFTLRDSRWLTRESS